MSIKVDCNKSTARVHRFHDAIALYTSDGGQNHQTVYFFPEDAARLAQVLSAYAFNAQTVPFGQSTHLPGHTIRGGDDEVIQE